MTSAYAYWLHDPAEHLLQHPLQQLLQHLSPAERDEMVTLKSPQRIRSFVLSRTLIRRLIHSRLQEPDPQLVREASGRLIWQGQHDWHISISHCPGHVAVMLAAAPCGIDVEIDRERDWEKIARRYFAASEQDYLSRLSPKEGKQAFFRLWTLKEAGVKAMGKGLAQHLARLSFDISNITHPVASRNDMAVKQVRGHDCTLAMALMTKEKASWHVDQLAFSELT